MISAKTSASFVTLNVGQNCHPILESLHADENQQKGQISCG